MPSDRIRSRSFCFVICVLIFISCQKDDSDNLNSQNCNQSHDVLADFVNPEGIRFQIISDGSAYRIAGEKCHFEAILFDPDFHDMHYAVTDSGITILANDRGLAPQFTFYQDFEQTPHFRDLFVTNTLGPIADLFTSMTLQSPLASNVDAYNALQKCLLAETCDFKDSRIDIGINPNDPSDQVLKLLAAAPDETTGVSKTSISTDLTYFNAHSDFWFEARYFIVKGQPHTIADFECSHIMGYPGPRLVIQDNKLGVENKFGSKQTYEQPMDQSVAFPANKWVTVKIHLRYDSAHGMVQVWQDQELIIDATGPTIPFDLWIHNRVEIGISATHQHTVLLVDDVRFAPDDF